jgi:hypothetical protein
VQIQTTLLGRLRKLSTRAQESPFAKDLTISAHLQRRRP